LKSSIHTEISEIDRAINISARILFFCNLEIKQIFGIYKKIILSFYL